MLKTTKRSMRRIALLLLMSAVGIAGCRAGGWMLTGPGSSGRGTPVHRVFCLFDQKPWLSLDAAGDRDPEGLHYRVFLDNGRGRGVHHEGTLHIELYRVDHKPDGGGIERTLVSDWVYPTSNFTRIKSKLLGYGYHVRLRWARKDIAGHEIEVVTRFEDPSGVVVSAGTKRLRAPKYSS